MKKVLNYLAVLTVTTVLFISCSGPAARMETITGKAGDLVVVIGKEVWKDSVGSTIRKALAQPQAMLPQREPIFSLISVPPEAFGDLFKTNRNILTVRISPTFTDPKVEFSNDTWAYPQAIVNIQASSPENFQTLFNENSDKIIAFFLNAERERLMSTYKKNFDKAIHETLLKDYHIKLYLPVGFNIAKQDSSFAWMRYDTPLTTQNIFVYTYPYASDSTFTQKFQVAKRNEMLKKYVPGPSPGSYMTTETAIPQDFNFLKFQGTYASEMRGLWKLEHDFMGGPYISLSVLDPARKRVITIEGDVYAPKNKKRNLIRQVAAMVYSLDLPDQETNAKILNLLQQQDQPVAKSAVDTAMLPEVTAKSTGTDQK